MKTTRTFLFCRLHWPVVGAFLVLMCSYSTCHAEIYKWVDEKGQTHYSDKKIHAKNAKVERMDLKPIQNVIEDHAVVPPANTLQQTKKTPSSKKAYQPPKQKWGGSGPETDEKRCALARDILSGAARHVSGAPTDAYDIKVAKRDVERFCR